MAQSKRKTSGGGGCIETLEARRMFAAGDLDKTFHGEGMTAIVPAGANLSWVDGGTVQNDGKVLGVMTGRLNGTFGVFIVRLNKDGTTDTTFGANHHGFVQIPDFSEDSPIVVQNDGKILGAGIYGGDMGIFRLTSTGILDKSFDNDGITTVSFGDFVNGTIGNDIAVQTDGKIVVVGTEFAETALGNDDIAVARLTPAGKLDATFGAVNSDGSRTGHRLYGLGGDDTGNAVAIDYNGTAATNKFYGTIVVAGHVDSGSAVVRIKPNGDPDTSFDGDGKVRLPFAGPDLARDVVIQPGGKIVLAGRVLNKDKSDSDFSLVRLLSSGKADPTFGAARTGQVIQDFGDLHDAANSLITSFGGGLIAAGRINENFGLAAYTPDGIPDAAFGGAAATPNARITNIGGVDDEVFSISRAPNQTIVAIGASAGRIGFARYQDLLPAVSVSTSDPSGSETGPDKTSFTFSRPSALPYATIVHYKVGGTATGPSTIVGVIPDYTGITASNPARPIDRSVVIPANATSVTITLTPVNDTIHEDPETVTIDIVASPDNTYVVGTKNRLGLVITDNDTAPVTHTLNPVADAYVRDGTSADMNFGTSNQLQAKSVAGVTRLSYIKFDLSSISTITSATLRLYGELNNTNQTNIKTSVYSGNGTAWVESVITYNHRPTLGPSPLATTTIVNTTPAWYEWNVTAYLKAQKAAGATLVTLVVKVDAASDPFVAFASKEASANKPQLVVG
ncbi:MAG TPA: DNRLRE domain-containing protein [Tepidisphaeraceae bacterium]|jgi:uncharacterized delta-60 repeat protein|nr:DNRLRE domain-containing protein [Tepidisphaeraceae bacterium]